MSVLTNLRLIIDTNSTLDVQEALEPNQDP